MSERLTQGLSISIVGLIIFSMIIGGYLIVENQKSVKKNEDSIVNQDKNIQFINKSLNSFIDKWENRIKVSNEVNNSTQRQLLALSHNQSDVLDTQKLVEKNILGNLTAHRMVTNYTRDDILIPLSNKTNDLIRQFNTTNEEGRGKAVQEILQAVNNNTALLEQLLSSHNNKG